MWWDAQNLNKARVDRSGKQWHFSVWHDVVDLEHVARVFFWNDARDVTGVFIFPRSARTGVSAIRNVIQKLTSDPAFRLEHKRDLRFPLERHYSTYPSFPEEGVGG